MVQTRTITKVDKEGEQYEEVIEPSPAALAVAAKFLKDNSIFSAPEQSGAMDEMKEQLEKRRAQRKVTQRDLQQALAQVGNDLLQ